MLPLPAPTPNEDPISSRLPAHVASVVLYQAGVHTRQVCRTHLALHPLLRAFAPHSLPNVDALVAALPTLPPTLTSLDLRAIPIPPFAGHPITPAALSAIVAALPHLQQLTLPGVPTTLTPALLHTLHAHPRLHTLLASSISPPYTLNPPAPSPQLPLAPPFPHVRSLCLPFAALAHLPPTHLPPTPHQPTFPALTSLSLCSGGAAEPLPMHLLSLAEAAPALRALDMALVLGNHCQLVEQLPAFRAPLTSLRLECHLPCSREAPTHALLHSIGALTTLRSLTLAADHRGWDLREAGWMSRLTRLTSLDLSFSFSSRIWGLPAVGPVAHDAAAWVPRLPLLQRLDLSLSEASGRLRMPAAWLACGEPSSFFRRLAAATQLRSLALRYLPLPPADAALLTSLQGLTSLQLHGCTAAHDASHVIVPWVSALRRLQHLAWNPWTHPYTHDDRPDAAPAAALSANPAPPRSPWRALASLPRLCKLELEADSYDSLLAKCLPDLLVALQDRLQQLCLTRHPGLEPPGQDADTSLAPLRVLEGMTCLEVLELSSFRTRHTDVLARHLRLPGSLRQCYVPRELVGTGLLRHLQAAHPLVVIRPHGRAQGASAPHHSMDCGDITWAREF